MGDAVSITQRCTIEGERAAQYAEFAGPALRAGMPMGMQKLCEAMQRAARLTPLT